MKREASGEDLSWIEVLGSPLSVQLAAMDARGLPRAGLLFLQNACENRCFFCASPGVTEMPAHAVTTEAQALAWIEAARGIAVERVCIGGTEPALHPALERCITELRRAGFDAIELMTSGLRLGELGIARHLATLGVTAVAVPLYAADTALHDAVVGHPSAYERTTRGLDAALGAGMRVEVHTLALRRTLAALPALAREVHARWGGTLAIGPSRPKPGVYAWADEAPTADELEQALEGVEHVSIVGLPLCVAPSLPRASAAVIQLYFRSTRTELAPSCASCNRRTECPGLVAAELARAPRVRPFA
jgi:molybdenum cofactor biosynthesis enzyme MoaA